MGAARLRLLWLLLAAVGFVAVGFVLTPLLDAWADGMDRLAGDAGGTGGALVLAVPWIACGAVLHGLSLWWIAARPAWHPWRDAVLSGLIWSAATMGLYVLVNLLDLDALFHYDDHAIADLEGDGLYIAFPAVVVPLFAAGSVIAGLVGANRIWATPEPKREEAFGARKKDV